MDGLVLRYSKYDYEELDRPRLRSQFLVLLIFISTLSLIAVTVAVCAIDGINKEIIILVAVGVITKNIVTYSSYMLQITNRISKYVIVTIAQKLCNGIIVILLLAFKVNDYRFYCIADLSGDVIAICIAYFFNRGLYFGKVLPIWECFKELKLNVSSGIILMLANWSASLLVGSAKMIIQWHWGELFFGKVSFAFSISNVFLVFITAISVVMFPSLQRVDEGKLPSMYKSIRGAVSPLLFFMMIFFFPGSWILEMWLPKYAVSLKYLAVLLPIIIYSSKVSLLTNNYLKVYRKEKLMLLSNAISIVLGIGLFALSAYVIDNVYVLLGCVVFVIAFNSILSEIFVMHTIHVKIVLDFVVELVMTVGFILCAALLNTWQGCLAYLALLVVYGSINYKSLKELFRMIVARFSKKKQTEAVSESEKVSESENKSNSYIDKNTGDNEDLR